MRTLGKVWRWLKRIVLLKPRRHRRFPVMEGAFVVIGPDTGSGRKIQILDISQGGLAFIYAGSPEDLDMEGTLGLTSGRDTYVDNVQFETVWDDPIPNIEKDIHTFRKKGVKFKWLGVLDRRQLKDFIKDNALED